MLRVSKKTQYGLRAMVFLARTKKKICSLKEVAEREDIPLNFLEKIILQLKKAMFLKAKKGVRGGYFLAKKPKDIKVGEIIKTLEGSLAPVLCIATEKEKRAFCAQKGRCKTKNVWQIIQKTLNEKLNSLTLEDLLKKKK